MPDTILEQAGDALSRAGQRLAEAESAVRDAVVGLNQAIDAAHAAGTGPQYARAMVNAGGHLGTLGRIYLTREIRSWDDIYEKSPRPVNQNDRELLDLHARPRPQASAFSDSRARSVPGALARAGQELARAETGYDTAYARFSDASDFAQHARVPADQAASLVTALSGPLGDISSELAAAEVDDWDASIILDLASELADGTEPPGFWAAAADARAEKGAGHYGAAAASWTLARDQLPPGHLMRDGLDSLISALRAASGTEQHVTRHGYIVHHSTEPRSPWSTGQLVEAVRNHAARLGDDKQALRKVLEGWTDGAIAAAFDAAREPDEAVARACLTATFERAERLRTQPVQDVSGTPAAQTFEERARGALTRAGEIAAEAEAGFRRAITGLNHAIDLAHAAGTTPQTVNRLVTDHASLGDAARGYLALEIREWERAYRAGTWNPVSALSDLHGRSLQPPSAPVSPQAAAEALTGAGIRLAQAEAVLDGALGRLDDALEFALHAGLGPGETQDLVDPAGHLGPISRQFLKNAEVTDWDLDGYTYDGEGEEIPPAFRDLHLLALATKGEGDRLAAAAIWETALTRLPDGHSWRPRVNQTIASLRAVAHPGDIVTRDGWLIRSKASVRPVTPGAPPPAAARPLPARAASQPAARRTP